MLEEQLYNQVHAKKLKQQLEERTKYTIRSDT